MLLGEIQVASGFCPEIQTIKEAITTGKLDKCSVSVKTDGPWQFCSCDLLGLCQMDAM